MKVIHFCTYPNRGGAGVAASRIHTRMCKLLGWDSHMVGTDLIYNKSVWRRITFALQYRLDRILSWGSLNGNWSFGVIGKLDCASRKRLRDADVACLYWISHGFLGLLEIAYILKIKKKVVWRLSDMWVFTGGCHYSNGCDRYKVDCGYCPALKSKREWDRSRLLMMMKKRLWSTEQLEIICPSSWMAEKARESSLLKLATISVVHTGIDVSLFKPVHLTVKKGNRTTILFIADGGLGSARKGGNDVKEINRRLKEQGVRNYEIIVAGGKRNDVSDGIRDLGFIEDTEGLIRLYSRSDFFLAPYREDNLPNTVIEAMACGLPTVCYDIGGIRDIVIDNETGLLADSYSINKITAHCKTLIEDKILREKLGNAARKLVVDKFNLDTQLHEFCRTIAK